MFVYCNSPSYRQLAASESQVGNSHFNMPKVGKPTGVDQVMISFAGRNRAREMDALAEKVRKGTLTWEQVEEQVRETLNRPRSHVVAHAVMVLNAAATVATSDSQIKELVSLINQEAMKLDPHQNAWDESKELRKRAIHEVYVTLAPKPGAWKAMNRKMSSDALTPWENAFFIQTPEGLEVEDCFTEEYVRFIFTAASHHPQALPVLKSLLNTGEENFKQYVLNYISQTETRMPEPVEKEVNRVLIAWLDDQKVLQLPLYLPAVLQQVRLNPVIWPMFKPYIENKLEALIVRFKGNDNIAQQYNWSVARTKATARGIARSIQQILEAVPRRDVYSTSLSMLFDEGMLITRQALDSK